jgi:hypothetical protein
MMVLVVGRSALSVLKFAFPFPTRHHTRENRETTATTDNFIPLLRHHG